jgi:hypothetical protein
MKRLTSLLSAGALIALLTPSFTAFAASSASSSSSSDITTEDVIQEIQPSPNDALPVPTSMPPNTGGGGGPSSIMMPYPGTPGGITVDATVTKEVTPDFLAINAWCDITPQASRDQVRTAIASLYASIKDGVGRDGRVRRSGSSVISPFYDPSGKMSNLFSGNLSLFIRITNKSASQRIADLVENQGCTSNWDVRLVDTQSYELGILDDLVTRLNKRKKIFEKLIKKMLTRVVSASLSTWVDAYSTYDPEANTVEATTTLSVTFDIGGRATIPSPQPVPMNQTKPAIGY